MKTGEKIASARKRHNLTQEQLAELLGVSRQAVSRWESDLAYPETENLVRLAELLGVSCDYLLKESAAENGAEPVREVRVRTREVNWKFVWAILFAAAGLCAVLYGAFALFALASAGQTDTLAVLLYAAAGIFFAGGAFLAALGAAWLLRCRKTGEYLHKKF